MEIKKSITNKFSRPMNVVEYRWRPPSHLWIPMVIFCFLLFFIDVFQYQTFNLHPISRPLGRLLNFSEDVDMKGFIIKTHGCRIPELDAFNPNINNYIFKEMPVNCNKGVPPLVDSNLTSVFILNNSLSAYNIEDTNILNCCYSVFYRKTPPKKPRKGKTDKVQISRCVTFNKSVNIFHENIIVKCFYNRTNIYTDFFSFVPIKGHKGTNANGKLPINVLVIGIDSISRLNFHRQMPKTYSILNKIKAVELLGYNKVGDNTFPNLIPILTGLSETELRKKCWANDDSYFDSCPFIWKAFKNKGYTTAFGEDAAWMGVFNYAKQGFFEQPTDYFWDTFNYAAEKQIGNEHRLNVQQCVGAREVYKVLLNYIEKFAKTMHLNKRPFFGFFWGSSLSHDVLNKPKLGDETFESFILEMKNGGVLNNTVFILMSDHGIRWGNIRRTFQGRVEELLPFIEIYLPEWYRETYSLAYSNLRRNSRRLTSPYDLHETLVDLTNPYVLTRDILTNRNDALLTKRGYSLFDLISTNRTCEYAGIASHWCACQNSVKLDVNDTTVAEAANFTVEYINNKLEGYTNCITLELAEILDARLQTFQNNTLLQNYLHHDYTITFKTNPSKAIFEVTVRRNHIKNKGSFEITGTVSRINLYRNQSSCISDFHLQLYCYCRYLL